MNGHIPRLVIAGVSSGVGKTTIASAVMAALARRGAVVQPFKAGPDYIDPTHHSLAAGRVSRNLDSFFLTRPRLLESFLHAVQSCDIAVIEGVMGLFDGRGSGESGSTAEIAKWLNAPVVLVVDATAASRSVAATVLGFARFDPAVRVAGVIVNRMASPRHAEMVTRAIEGEAGLPILGAVPRKAAASLPGRHLGLVLAGEASFQQDDLVRLATEHLDLDRLIALASSAPDLSQPAPELFPAQPLPRRARVAIAQDAAFSFYYQDTLDLITAHGGELVPFSPMADPALPENVGAVYLGGGYPEIHAETLAANMSMQESIRRAAADGMPIYAECGGLMYLSEGLVDHAGTRHRMVGLQPGWATMRDKVRLGYVEAEVIAPNHLLPVGSVVRGHEFHYSDHPGGSSAVYRLPGDRLEGFAAGSVLASYIHLHFGTDPRLAPALVALASGAK